MQILLANLIHSLVVATTAANTSSLETSDPEVQGEARMLIDELTSTDKPMWKRSNDMNMNMNMNESSQGEDMAQVHIYEFGSNLFYRKHSMSLRFPCTF